MGYVGGMQAKDKSGRYRKTICNAKHWSSYDVERGIDPSPGPRSFDPANGWPEGGELYNRGSFNAVVSEQDLAETYWPQFRAAVRGADLGGTMCSYLLRQIFLLILSPYRLTDFLTEQVQCRLHERPERRRLHAFLRQRSVQQRGAAGEVWLRWDDRLGLRGGRRHRPGTAQLH